MNLYKCMIYDLISKNCIKMILLNTIFYISDEYEFFGNLMMPKLTNNKDFVNYIKYKFIKSIIIRFNQLDSKFIDKAIKSFIFWNQLN